MKNPEGISEIHGILCEREVRHRALVENRIAERLEVAFSHLECLRARVHAVQYTHSGGDEAGPPARSTTRIESLRSRGEEVPRKQLEILLENGAQFGFLHFGLIEARPFPSKRLNGPFV
jgi:hypothetical protein